MELKAKPEGKRIVSIDRMRGFSLLGIFLVNMISFHSPYFYIDPEKWWHGTLNSATYRFIDIFVQASFYPLFAMLFGYGLVILRERTLQKGIRFTPLAIRRLSILLLMGLFHAFLIWEGDILTTYAVCGFVFLLLIGWNARRLLIAGFTLYIVPNLLLLLLLAMAMFSSPDEPFTMYDKDAANQALLVYQTGSFAEVTEQRMAEWYKNNDLIGFIFYLITILPLFMIGAGAAKLKLFENVENKRHKMGNYAIALALAGLFIKSLPYLIDRNLVTDYAQDAFGGVLLAMAYALFIALASEKRTFDKFLVPLEAAGRLSISNYLFQSIVSTLIFYSYGLGYYGKISIFAGSVLALGIYAFQLAASTLYIKRYYHGPVEWLWRSGTYMKKQRFKREDVS